ncbi:MAG: GNAT family N-acetyltransferase [Deltaproteobacteria bacterium]|nr:GNAT family N-acetyltransferase [Deltaproteobacteria bacterium]
MTTSGFRIQWQTEVGHFEAIEPTLEEVTAHAAMLAAGYNDPLNAELMGHTEPLSDDEVVDHYDASMEDGVRSFLLFFDGALVGDGDLRGERDGAAEFAFMIAAPSIQGKGLGTRFAVMIHAFGFAQLGLSRIYASVVPHNVASRRVFEKVGYRPDDGPEARSYADEPGDVTLIIDRATFERAHAPALEQIQISPRR